MDPLFLQSPPARTPTWPRPRLRRRGRGALVLFHKWDRVGRVLLSSPEAMPAWARGTVRGLR
eukprot:6477792-Lingulodinium_polyedra.AAC.1